MIKNFIKPKSFIAALMVSGALISGCSDDDGFSSVDNQNPVITLESEAIHWEFSLEFRIKAKIDDADGIKTINLKNADLFLDKTIDILAIKGPYCSSYDLDYKFTVPDTLKSESFPIVITVEDLVGNVSSATFEANMDGDFTKPVFTLEPSSTINVIMPSFNFKFAVSDNRIIKKVLVKFPDLNINEEIANDGKTYEYKKTITVGDEYRDYKGVVTAFDEHDNKVEKEITISRGALKDYDRMYLCDVENENDLISDVCGVPMLIDHTGEFEYTAYYYNAAAGTKVRFIPQKNSFGPICFGLNPSNNASLTPDPDEAQPIVLDKAGVYYKIVVNTKAATYSTSTYTVAEAFDPMPGKLGSDGVNTGLNTWCTGTWNAETGMWDDAEEAWWQTFKVGLMTDNPREVDPCFEYNPQNPHIIQILNCPLEKGSFNFHPHNWHHDGWWDYCTWKPEKETVNDPEIWKFVGSYGKNPTESQIQAYNNDVENDNHANLTIPKAGNYDIIFDIHLGRMKIVPSK